MYNARRMNAPKLETATLAEVATEVAGVMFKSGINEFRATQVVMARREMMYGQGREIANLARALADKALKQSSPELRGYVRQRSVAPFTYAAASHEALAQAEQ